MDAKLVLIILALAIIAIGCTQQDAKIQDQAEQTESLQTQTSPDQPNNQNASVLLKGFCLSPKSFEPTDFTDFFEKAKLIETGNWQPETTKTQDPVTVVTVSQVPETFGLCLSKCKALVDVMNVDTFMNMLVIAVRSRHPSGTQDPELKTVISWAGDWNELEKENGGAPAVVAGLAPKYDYVPLIELQFFTQSSGQLLRPLDEQTKQNYKNRAVEFVKKYRPEYLAIGIEVNVLYEKSPADFEEFVKFYGEVYDAVKKESPDTKVFTIFQLEKMKGLQGGLFGGTNDAQKAEWQLLDKFQKSDLAAFTTYPDLIYKNPSEIPDKYYSEITQHTSKPIAFTEIGWHSAASPTAWESSEDEQTDFIERFFVLSEDLNAKILIWPFMYDQNTIEPFNSMGLRNKDGSAKVAWDKWINK